MDIEKEIESNTLHQMEVLKQIKKANNKCREFPLDKISLFELSMLMHQYDLYNAIIKELDLILLKQTDG